MMRCLPLLLVVVPPLAFAQDVKESDVSAATRRYRAYRVENTEPNYGLAKVKAAIKAIKPTKGKDEDSQTLASPAWTRMTTPERFTYCMLHGEDQSQNCDVMPWTVDEEHKIFGQLSGLWGGDNWSDRQFAFLKNHRKEMIRLMRGTISEKHRVGYNLKQAIVELKAYELVPDLVRIYDRDHKDQDMLTVLALLMKDGRDKPFLASITYRKLYGPDANYQSSIVANPENQRLMTDRALAYYRRRVG